MDELRRYPIKGEKTLSPRFFSTYASEHRGVVAADGTVTVFGCRFTIVDAVPPAGSDVQLDAKQDGGFAVLVADLIAYEAVLAVEQEAARLAEVEARYRKADQDRVAAKAFNAALGLPFKWSSANRAVRIREGAAGLPSAAAASLPLIPTVRRPDRRSRSPGRSPRSVL